MGAGEEHIDIDAADSAYGRRVGERLRAIRRQKRLSLQDVESQSEQEFKCFLAMPETMDAARHLHYDQE